MCVCVCERERVCVCVCVCVRERERERERNTVPFFLCSLLCVQETYCNPNKNENGYFSSQHDGQQVCTSHVGYTHPM